MHAHTHSNKLIKKLLSFPLKNCVDRNKNIEVFMQQARLCSSMQTSYFIPCLSQQPIGWLVTIGLMLVNDSHHTLGNMIGTYPKKRPQKINGVKRRFGWTMVRNNIFGLVLSECHSMWPTGTYYTYIRHKQWELINSTASIWSSGRVHRNIYCSMKFWMKCNKNLEKLVAFNQ